MKQIVSTNLRETLHYFLIVILFYGIQSCKSPNGPTTADVALTVTDVSCTEAWLKLTVNNLTSNTKVQLVRNSSLVNTFNITSHDTTLYDDSLSPNQTYVYQLFELQNGNAKAKSEMVTAKTMDTTSSNFTWETFTFGGNAGSSALYDVSIVNDTCIFAVGEIYQLDSLGQPNPNAYNLIQWNGNEWKLSRIKFYTFCGQPSTGSYPTRSIFAYSGNNIWVSSNSQIVHYNGENQLSTECISVSVNKLWGSEENNLFAVGNNGKIAHYYASQWSSIESSTSSIINDIWGITNRQGKLILYCPVSSFFVPGDKKILKITGSIVDSVEWNRDVRLYSAWTSNDNFLYVCGEGAYVNKFGKWEKISLPEVGTNSIRGNDINDIFIVGDYGFKAHFDGVRWQVLSTYNERGYSKVDVKGNIVAICGNYNGKGLIEIGIRN